MRSLLAIVICLAFAAPGVASAQSLSAEQAEQFRSVAAHPAECSRLRRQVDQYVTMQQRAATLDNDLWKERLAAHQAAGRTVFLWAAGSKAVSFLASVGSPACIRGIVDINPHKRRRFLPAFPHPILHPEDLADHSPDVVIAMNPVYEQEIAGMMNATIPASELEVMT